MPVSKKRKKGGKPVQRQAQPTPEQQEATEHPEEHGGPPPLRSGKPRNPFVSHQPQLRGSQRGR